MYKCLALFIIVKSRKQPKRLSTIVSEISLTKKKKKENPQKPKPRSIFILFMEHYTAMIKNELLVQATI